MKLKAVVSMCVVGAIAACAENPTTTRAAYVPTAQYENLSCQQLGMEAKNVSNRAHDAANLQRRHRTQDEIKTAAGLVIFWPALLFVRGNDETTAELAQLKGQMQAIEQVSTAKQCGIQFQRA